jgi:excisionase family DNA binding protein
VSWCLRIMLTLMSRHPDLLTTSEAAALLGSSRQHVVDLCERGRLPFIKVGAHRRLRRIDVDAVLRADLTRDQLKALWLHHAVAGRLVVDPDGSWRTPHPTRTG